MRKTAVAAGIAVFTALAFTAVVANRTDARTEDSAPATSALDDAGIVAIFDLANTADIETGRLGAERAHTKEVKDYAIMLSQVHTEVRQKGRDLAKKLGVTPKLPEGNTMLRDHQAAMERLRLLTGPAFERAFLEHEQAFHAAVIDAVKNTLLPAIENQELRDFVASLAPAFEAHRVMAEHLQKKIAE